MKIRLAKPWIPVEALKDVENILKTGWVASGEKAEEFAKEVAKIEGYKYGVSTNSCTSALQIALETHPSIEYNIKIQNITFPATINAIIASRHNPSITDKNFDLGIDLFGLKKGYRGWPIGDCACSLGSKGDYSKPDISCYSFHARKIITTGEGGVLCTDNKSIFEKSIELTGCGNHKSFFYNMKMSDINATIGLYQLKFLKEILKARRAVAIIYNEYLPDEVDVFGQIGRKINNKYNYQTFVGILPIEANINTIINKMQRLGIECNFGTYRLNEISYYNKYIDNKSNFKKYNYIALPFYLDITENEVKIVCRELQKNLKGIHHHQTD